MITSSVTGSGNVIGTSLTFTLPPYQEDEYLVFSLSSNLAPVITFGAGVTAILIASAADRCVAYRLVRDSPSITGGTVTSSSSAVLTWTVTQLMGVDPSLPVATTTNSGNSADSPIIVPIADLGYISTGTEYGLLINSVNSSASWVTTPNTLYATTSGNAATMVSGYSELHPDGKLTYEFPSNNRGNDGVNRNESSVGIIFQQAPGGVENIITNGSFESPQPVEPGWETEGNTAGTPEYTKSTVGVTDGKQSQKFQYSGMAGDNGKFFAIYQAPITASPGDTLEFSIDVSGVKSNCNLIVGIEDFKTGGVYISETDTIVELTSTPTRYTVSHTCKPDTAFIAVYIQVNEVYSTSSVTVQLDRAILKTVDIPSSKYMNGFYAGSMYGGGGGWLFDGDLLDVNGITTSVVSASPTLAKTAALSNRNLSVATAIGNIALTGGRSLSVANHTVVTSTTSPTLAVVRNLVTGNLSLLVTASQANIDRLIGINPNNLSLVTSSSTPATTSDTPLSMNNMLVAIDEDSVEMTTLRSMGVEPISVAPIVSTTAAQIGYPVYDVGSDNIYAIGSMREGEYGIATINNNQIYEVVEHDGI